MMGGWIINEIGADGHIEFPTEEEVTRGIEGDDEKVAAYKCVDNRPVIAGVSGIYILVYPVREFQRGRSIRERFRRLKKRSHIFRHGRFPFEHGFKRNVVRAGRDEDKGLIAVKCVYPDHDFARVS